MSKELKDTLLPDPKTLLLGIFTPNNRCADMQAYFDEFVSLVNTREIAYEMTYFTSIRTIDNGFLLTKGKLDTFVKMCDDNNIERVICSERLTPLQHRELEDITRTMVIDRAELILEIFKRSATTAEGHLQIEMAELEMFRSRLSGQGAEFAQQAGYVGGKGPGETYKEKIKRILADKLRKAGQRIEALQKVRDNQRKQRMQSKIPLICIVGYTNAGKSSLLNSLTNSEVLVENKLFATLDTTTREWFLGNNRKVLVSDTVGFISELPHKLIQAFKSTLDEARYANILLHVVDVTNHGWKDQIRVVQETLLDIGVKPETPLIYLFNKIDMLSEAELELLKIAVEPYKPGFFIAAKNRETLSLISSEVLNLIGGAEPEPVYSAEDFSAEEEEN